MTDHNHCPHQWNQAAPFTPTWVQSIPPAPVHHQPKKPITPNPVFPSTATLPVCTPLQLKKTGPRTVLVTVSIPTESIFTLPSKALEIKTIRKNLKLTQCRFFNSPPPVCGIPQDTHKLFLRGFVRKDIQYSEPVRQSATSVESSIKDFVIDVPYTCVVDLGRIHGISPTLFSKQQEYEFPSSASLPLGFSSKDRLMSGDLSEFNVLSQEFLNLLPNCELIFSQINEMDDALDRVPMPCGPFEEGVFRTVQEKMVVMIQLRLTFPPKINPPPTPCDCRSHDHCSKNVHRHHPILSTSAKLLKCLLKSITR